MKSASLQDTYGKLSPSSAAVRNALFFLSIFLVSLAFEAGVSAQAETRTLKMYFTHTRESATITFKRNGKYLPAGLKKANRFLRDWRRKEPTKMDPALLDLVWEVYQKSGSRQPIKVISGYRSPRTNNMLRRRGRKVAKTSQHTKGKALDFFLTDVSVAKLRALGLKAHRGGVGYYAGSFVHLDTGRVRHWPRMSARQLKRVFPKGKTIHVPSNGKPLRGYKVARANLKKGLNADGTARTTTVRRTLLASLFNNNGDNSDQDEGPTPSKRPNLPKPVAAASLQRQRPKPSGPDPFSLENTAAASNTPSPVPQGRVAVPRLRPSAPAVPDANANVAIAALEPANDPAQNQLQPATTELALAAPESLPNVLRPSADVPDAGSATTPIATAPEASPTTLRPPAPVSEVASTTNASDPEVAALTSRIETALARGRAPSPVESAVEQQSNSQLAEALKTIPKPTAPQQRPAASDTRLALAALPEPTPRSARLPEPAAPAVPESKPVVDSSRFASLDANDASTPSLRQALQPDLIAATASANRLRVPLPSASPANQRIAAAVDAAGDAGDSAQNYDLSLGDLDGRSVKKWAVSVSTRVGPSAVLIAPNYRQGTQQLAPDRVYSAGFARTRFTLRSDSFSGRALTRVAFAKFRNN